MNKKTTPHLTIRCTRCTRSVTFLDEHPRVAQMRLKHWMFGAGGACCEVCNGSVVEVMTVKGRAA